MCLTLGGGQNMCEPVVPPTEKGKQQRACLMILGFIHMALAIMLCFIIPMQGIYELIDVAILFCALAQMNFCCLIIYIINITINFFVIFNQLGLAVQNGQLTDAMESASFAGNLALATMIMLAVYYVVANIFCFFAYREFKGMMFDAGMDGGGIMTQGFNRQRRESSQDSRSGSADQRGQAYQGGMGQPAASAPPAQSSSGGGGFKSFQGKGRTIGGS